MNKSASEYLSPTFSVLLAAFLFGVVNILWRFGEGSALTLAATRAVAGLVLFAPLLAANLKSRTLQHAFSTTDGRIAIVLSGASLWTAAILFRAVPGPTAAAIISCSPLVALLMGRFFGSRKIPLRCSVAIVVGVVCAAFAAGPQVLAWSAVLPAVLFLSIDVSSVLAAERARRTHDAAPIIIGGLVVGAVPAPLLWLAAPAATSGLVVACVLAVVGTMGRLLRAQALGSLNAAVVASSTQMTALVTAVGGAVVFADQLDPGRFVALLCACVAAVLALVWAAQYKPPVPAV